jgi:hypothetical protein
MLTVNSLNPCLLRIQWILSPLINTPPFTWPKISLECSPERKLDPRLIQSRSALTTAKTNHYILSVVVRPNDFSSFAYPVCPMGSASIKEHDLTFPSLILVPRREHRFALLNLKETRFLLHNFQFVFRYSLILLPLDIQLCELRVIIQTANEFKRQALNSC